jgi:hypothetical protein
LAAPIRRPGQGQTTRTFAGRLTDADLDGYIRRTAITVHHPIGTCRAFASWARASQLAACAR